MKKPQAKKPQAKKPQAKVTMPTILGRYDTGSELVEIAGVAGDPTQGYLARLSIHSRRQKSKRTPHARLHSAGDVCPQCGEAPSALIIRATDLDALRTGALENIEGFEDHANHVGLRRALGRALTLVRKTLAQNTRTKKHKK